jgi:hypothetical protein
VPKKFESDEARRTYYRELMRQRRAAEKAGRPFRRCAFCRKPQARLWGTDPFICDGCVAKAAKAMQAAKAKARTARRKRRTAKTKRRRR